jgi:sodium/bile acid cotransporter 7
MAGGQLVRLERAEQIAVAFAGSQKTLPVGLFLFEAYYRADYPLAVVPLLFYHAGQLLADTVIADVIVGRGSGSKP